MSQGKRSRPGPRDPASSPKAPDVPRPLWNGATVPSGNYEYYGLRPPAVGAVQARPLPYSPGWTPPDWLLEYHGLQPAKPAEGPAPPAVQQKEASAETAAEEEVKASDEVGTRAPEADGGPVVQGKLGGGAAQSEVELVHAAAARGTSGAGASLPYLDEIQHSFGRHDVSHMKAHTGQVATEAARAMGAEAYTTGEHVAFAGAPSLHTAAHEAAHVVQQRSGVQLKDGVGEVGDLYEQHADAVADLVEQGKSAEALLEPYAQPSGRPQIAEAAPTQFTRRGKGDTSSNPAKTSSALPLVEKEGHLQLSESEPTIVGWQVGGKWMVTISGGRPSAPAKATIGSLRGSRDAAVVEMRAATKTDGGWVLHEHSLGVLMQGDGAQAQVLGVLAERSGNIWHVRGQRGSKDKLPAELAAVIRENDLLTLGAHHYAWMSYPAGVGKESLAGWATTGHDKKQVEGRVASFREDADQLPEPLRSQVLAHVEVMAVVSTVEGGYSATSGQVADTSGSLGIFQWARSRDPDAGSDSIDRFFVRIAQRAQRAEEKLKKDEEPSADELAALDAWEQAQRMGIGVSKGRTTITRGEDTKFAGGLDLELAAAGSSGLQDSYHLSQALRASRSIDKTLEKKRKSKPRKQSAEDSKKGEVALLDDVIRRLAAAMQDILASDLVKDDPAYVPAVKAQLSELERFQKEEAPPTEEEGTAKKAPNLDEQIRKRVHWIKTSDSVLRHIIDVKIRKAPGMATEEMRRYQLVAALDWIKEFQTQIVYPSYGSYRSRLLGNASVGSSSATVEFHGRRLHLTRSGGSTVGDHLRSEKALAEMTMLGVNRPAYVATALWAALQKGDVAQQVATHLRTVFQSADRIAAAKKPGEEGGSQQKHAPKKGARAAKHVEKKGELNESGLKQLFTAAPPELRDEVAAGEKALDELKALLWPPTAAGDDAQIGVRFRQEAMCIYNTIEGQDAKDNNRVGRFVTIELIDWQAVEAAKARP